jgi:diadenosine tetraphosphate (Ap4A) HIT family hydrolase
MKSGFAVIGDAITAVCNPMRINYDILCNSDAFLHAHIFPRYEWEDENRIKHPVWQYPRENWSMEKYQFSEEKHGEMKRNLTAKLKDLMDKNYK